MHMLIQIIPKSDRGVVLFPEATLLPNFVAAVNRAMAQVDAPYTIMSSPLFMHRWGAFSPATIVNLKPGVQVVVRLRMKRTRIRRSFTSAS
ncbi:hypothetical protein V6N13_051684 [Hibiscus sabdariffa]